MSEIIEKPCGNLKACVSLNHSLSYMKRGLKISRTHKVHPGSIPGSGTSIKELAFGVIRPQPAIASCFAPALPVLASKGTMRPVWSSPLFVLTAASFLTPSDKSASHTIAYRL